MNTATLGLRPVDERHGDRSWDRPRRRPRHDRRGGPADDADDAHPLVRAGEAPTPGIVMTGFGRVRPMGIVIAHVVFGLVVGAVYAGLV